MGAQVRLQEGAKIGHAQVLVRERLQLCVRALGQLDRVQAQ